tara:strand:+ start:6572 stop:7759 length:1188 start_codon:yes stop_codon:yes gene_type:complete
MLDAVIDSLPIAIFCKNASEDFRFVLWNKMQEEVTGIPREKALGFTDFDLFPRSEAEGFRAMDEHVVLTGATVEIPAEEVQTGAGKTIWLHTVKVQVEDPALGKNLLLGMSEDVTERRLLNDHLDRKSAELESTQLQLIQAEKMESIGRLAAGVAHEVKNPLALLLMGVEYLDGGVKPGDPNLPEIIEEMREAIHRADKIIRGLVDFSSSGKLTLTRQDIRPVIDQALLLVRHELLRAGATVNTRYQPDLPDVRLDAAKFEQVIVNLLINALHALKDTEQPELDIAIWSVQAGADDLDEGSRSVDRVRPGDEVVIVQICDNGPGIPPDKLNQIFEPFFTTKPTGVGTGLGLSVVRNIIQLHKGRIEIGNRPEGGVRVVMSLRTPAATSEAIDNII